MEIRHSRVMIDYHHVFEDKHKFCFDMNSMTMNFKNQGHDSQNSAALQIRTTLPFLVSIDPFLAGCVESRVGSSGGLTRGPLLSICIIVSHQCSWSEARPACSSYRLHSHSGCRGHALKHRELVEWHLCEIAKMISTRILGRRTAPFSTFPYS